MENIVLEAKNIHKAYGNLPILQGVNLQVQRGEIVSIVGRSGAGKSTLLHILGTLDPADSGTLHINQTEVLGLNAKRLAAFRNQHIGFVFQFHHLLPEFTALENVSMPAFIARQSGRSVEDRAKALLERLGLGERLHHKPTQLSGGEQQRVAVARALINQPDIVFADEPTGNLDSAASQNFHQLIVQLRNELRQAFVIVTHNMELAALSNRCLEMKDGQLQS